MGLKKFLKRNIGKLGLGAALTFGATQAPVFAKAKPVRPAEDRNPIAAESQIDIGLVLSDANTFGGGLDFFKKDVKLYERALEEKNNNRPLTMQSVMGIVDDIYGGKTDNKQEQLKREEHAKMVLESDKYGNIAEELEAKRTTLAMMESLAPKITAPETPLPEVHSRFFLGSDGNLK